MGQRSAKVPAISRANGIPSGIDEKLEPLFDQEVNAGSIGGFQVSYKANVRYKNMATVDLYVSLTASEEHGVKKDIEKAQDVLADELCKKLHVSYGGNPDKDYFAIIEHTQNGFRISYPVLTFLRGGNMSFDSHRENIANAISALKQEIPDQDAMKAHVDRHDAELRIIKSRHEARQRAILGERLKPSIDAVLGKLRTHHAEYPISHIEGLELALKEALIDAEVEKQRRGVSPLS